MLDKVKQQRAEWLDISLNYKGKEWLGSKFHHSARPDRFKRYDGPYIRLKTSMYNAQKDGDIQQDSNLKMLEKILNSSYGFTSVKYYGYQSEMLWSYPSAGACYPVEVYVVVHDLEGVDPGVYHYSAQQNSLYKVNNLDNKFLLDESLLPEDRDASVQFIISSVLWRSAWKYSHRGYRFCMIDAGHALSNFQMVLQSMHMPFSTYTFANSKYLKSVMNLDASEEPFAVVSVKRDGSKAPSNMYDATSRLNNREVSRCVNNDQVPPDFDWGYIFGFQDTVAASTGEPTEGWLASYKTADLWAHDELLSLLVRRRSAASFLPVNIAKSDLEDVLDFVDDLEFPFDIYAFVQGVEDLEPGMYKFDKGLQLIQPGDYRRTSCELAFDQEVVYEASVVYCFVSKLPEDHEPWQYQKQLVEVGALCQAMYLKAHEQNLGFSAIAGFYDVGLREAFGLEPHQEVLYMGIMGKLDANSAFRFKHDRYLLNKPDEESQARLDKKQSGNQNDLIIKKMEESCKQYADSVALRYGDASYTYAQFWEQIEKYSELVQEKIPHKYPVGIYMKNGPTYLFAYYGLLKAGYIPMLIDSTFTEEELTFIHQTYHVDSLMMMDAAGELEIKLYNGQHDDFDPDQFANVAVCRFSSGTTGKPKCLMFTQDAVINAGTNWAAASSITADDIVLCTAMFHNGLAFNTSLLSVFLNGATLVINKNITPQSIWDLVQKEKSTVMIAFPVIYDMLAKSKYCQGEHTLRLCLSSSAPLHQTIKDKFTDKTGMFICDYYGIVEAGPATFNDGSVPGSVGITIPGVNIRIVNDEDQEVSPGEVGSIEIKTASMSKGYYNASFSFDDLITPDGYYKTSDTGFLKDGFLFITGRTNDIINVAGKKVDPSEIENVLIKMDEISDVVVAGVNNASNTSQYPVAFIVADESLTNEMIVQHLQQHLAPFKMPQRFVRVEKIPRSGVGKLKRNEVVKLLTPSMLGGGE